MQYSSRIWNNPISISHGRHSFSRQIVPGFDIVMIWEIRIIVQGDRSTKVYTILFKFLTWVCTNYDYKCNFMPLYKNFVSTPFSKK